jgi:hypothetical protein
MDTKTDVKKSKTAEQFFAEMYRDLRRWNEDIPDSPERVDPVMRILLQLFSHQLAQIDERIDHTWRVATNSVIEALAPEAKRWPVPAYTVMRCEPADPVVEIDPHTKFFYKETREGGRTFFFSAQRTERLVAANVKHILLTENDSLVDILASPEGSPVEASSSTSSGSDTPRRLYIAVEFSGLPSSFNEATLFLKGHDDVLRQVRWAKWAPQGESGFNETGAFCPGISTSVEELFTEVEGDPVDWGGFRTSTDLFKQLEDHWVVLPPRFVSAWKPGPPDRELQTLLDGAKLQPEVESDSAYWIRIDLPPGGDKSKLREPLSMYFNCFVATNRNELTLFRHTGGDSLVEIELAEPIDTVLEIVRVEDSQGNEYSPRHLIQPGTERYSYTTEQRDEHLVLWFDLSSRFELPPDSITVTYTVTEGVVANGIAEGKITELYESHPGVVAAENVLPVRGAIPARSDEQMVKEISARLRNRDRAMTFTSIADWATTFDPRIRRAECANGIERTPQGVRRCVVVQIAVRPEDLYSEDEKRLLAQRLARFLKSRSPVNTQYKVEVVAA